MSEKSDQAKGPPQALPLAPRLRLSLRQQIGRAHV